MVVVDLAVVEVAAVEVLVAVAEEEAAVVVLVAVAVVVLVVGAVVVLVAVVEVSVVAEAVAALAVVIANLLETLPMESLLGESSTCKYCSFTNDDYNWVIDVEEVGEDLGVAEALAKAPAEEEVE